MHFLTEDEIKSRCPQQGGTLHLAAGERLTPAAVDYAGKIGVQVVAAPCATSCTTPGPAPAACAAPVAPAPSASAASCASAPSGSTPMTRLDANTLVSKGDPRVEFRGKLDTLLATAALVQTQFDPKERLSPYLRDCLNDLAAWVMQILSAEVSGGLCVVDGMGGMDVETLYAVSRDPARYLGVQPFVPGAAHGANAMLVNWLRAVTRETEVAAVKCGCCREDITGALNRLSSAVYVLMLLTVAAERGVAMNLPRK